MKLPSGISSADFSSALQEWANAIGADWVFAKDEDVELYDDSYTPFFGEPELQRHAAAAVAPSSVEQVQAIVLIANKFKIPLYAISTGRNIGYGGSAPVYSGSVIVDLKRMNRIIEVNEQQGYVVVEPGVSFFELYQHLEGNGHNLMISPPEPGWGSPIGNALDHGIGGVAGDNFGMVNGVEVVLASGEVLRTGMGAVKTSRLWQSYRYGFGPYIDGMFSQSNFGIVTKMGFWCIRRPEMQSSFVVASFKSDDLHPMVEQVQIMRDQGLIFTSGGNSPIRAANNNTDGAISQKISEVKSLLDRRDGGAHSDWDALGKAKSIPVATVSGGARGPERTVKAVIEHAREVFSKIPGTSFREVGTIRFPVKADEIDDATRSFIGIPTLWAFSRMAVQGTSHGHYYFSPMIRATAEDMFAVNSTVRNVLLDFGDADILDRFGWRGGLGSYPKSYMLLYEFLVTGDVNLNRKRRELFTRLVNTCGEKGWAEYRTPPAFQDLVMAQYSNNNHVLRRFHETIKDALDPNGILSPGKSGIWPKHLRQSAT